MQKKKSKNNSIWSEGIKRLQEMAKDASVVKKSKREIIEECRKIREEVWKEEFEYRT